jgi:hypothetical protein
VGVWPHRLEAHLVACARELSQSWLGGLVVVGSPPATQPASTVPRRKTASTAKNDLVAIVLKRELFPDGKTARGDEISMKFLDVYFVTVNLIFRGRVTEHRLCDITGGEM